MKKLYKLEKHNKIHREGYEAGYAKCKKEESISSWAKDITPKKIKATLKWAKENGFAEEIDGKLVFHRLSDMGL